jgi:hypothetical protein
MDLLAFAAARRDRMKEADTELLASVREALAQWNDGDSWYAELMDDASVLWLEVFSAEAPNADPDRFMPRFREMLGEALSQTGKPSNPPTDAEVNRVLRWLSAATINNATFLGNGAHGGRGMRWVTMGDSAVRGTHRATNGQIADSDGTFDVGGYDLHYPGEPVGPPEIWINCRCVLAPARVEGALTVATVPAAADNDSVDSMPEGDLEDEELPTDELEDDEEEITEIPVHGVAAIEGKNTGDNRKFKLGSLSFAPTPQPIGFEFESGHGSDNSRVAIVGRIDEFWKVELEDGTVEARWRGVIMPSKPYASQAIEGIIDGSYTGLSVIVDTVTLDIEETEAEALALGEGQMMPNVYSAARIRRFDMVPTGAFYEGWTNLGHEFADELDEEALAACAECAENAEDAWKIVDLTDLTDEELAEYEAMTPEEQEAFEESRSLIIASAAYAPGTKDGPGWITHPIPTGRIRRYWTQGKGAGKIGWGAPGDFNRCRKQLAKYIANPDWLAGACANMHKEVLGVWPNPRGGNRGHHSGGTAMSTITAGAVVARPAEAFKNPQFTGPTPVTIEGDRIFGHIATWGVCHIGIQDQCVMAPHSSTNYGYYRTGVVETDEGRVPVGQITMSTGHASIKASAKDAVAHYDNTGSVVADVASGEDSYGIWFAGVLRPNLTDEQVAALAASALSGDWRRTASGLELVAALAVNVPGFPIPRISLAASAVAEGEEGQRLDEVQIDTDNLDAVFGISPVTRDSVTAGLFPTAEEIAGIVRTAVDEYRASEASERIREERLAAINPFLERAREHSLSRITDFFQEA